MSMGVLRSLTSRAVHAASTLQS